MTVTRLFKNTVLWCTVGPVMSFLGIICLFAAIFISAVGWLICRDDTITFVDIYAMHYMVIVSICLLPLGVTVYP